MVFSELISLSGDNRYTWASSSTICADIGSVISSRGWYIFADDAVIPCRVPDFIEGYGARGVYEPRSTVNGR